MGANVNGLQGEDLKKTILERKPPLVLEQFVEMKPKRVKPTKRPLMHAITKQRKDIVALLLRNGAIVTEHEV